MRRTIVLLGLLTSCTSPNWVKSVDSSYSGNAQAAQFECERDVRQSGYYGAGLIGAYNANSFYRRCMMAKGFYDQAPP